MVPGQSDPFHLGYWPTDVPQQEPQVQPATILLWHVELWFGNLSASLGFFSCRKLYCELLQEWLQQLKVGILNDLQEWFQQHKQVIINNPTVSFADISCFQMQSKGIQKPGCDQRLCSSRVRCPQRRIHTEPARNQSNILINICLICLIRMQAFLR